MVGWYSCCFRTSCCQSSFLLLGVTGKYGQAMEGREVTNNVFARLAEEIIIVDVLVLL